MRAFTIGAAAKAAGVGVETIRFYERRGLIEQPAKPSGSGLRPYSSDIVRRVRFIRKAQEVGFSLREILDLLWLRSDPSADCSEVRSRAVAKLAEIETKMSRLENMRAALEQVVASCPSNGELRTCTIIDALERVEGSTSDPSASQHELQ